jgi:hypothetical protein
VSEIGLWHAVRGAQPTRLLEESIPLEKDLENWIFEDPTLISPSLHRVRKQILLGTKVMDFLAIEEPGVWVVCELKKTALYRDSLVQAIDYVTRLDMLSSEQLRKLVSDSPESLPEKTQQLVNKALSREAAGEDRNIRVVLAGIGVREDLRHMVRYLSNKFSFPISICTFAAVAAPGDDPGIILMRDISEDSVSDGIEAASFIEYKDRLLGVKQYFKTSMQSQIFDELTKVFANQPHFYVRPWKKSIMIAPEQHHGRYLAYFTPSKEGVTAMVGSDAILEFFPDADISEITSAMGQITFENSSHAHEWASVISRSVANVTVQTESNSQSWNGQDWYFAFGGSVGRIWADAVNFGFVSAGGGEWYSKTVKALPVGARVFVYIPKIGYVGVGVTTGPAINYLDSREWQEKNLSGTYRHPNGEPEFIVPVKWLKTVSPSEAIFGNRLFASQLSTCKLRDVRTLKVLTEKFSVPFIESPD